MRKINCKRILAVCGLVFAVGLLFYTRFVNLGWGLPYPMHADEWQNMVLAIQKLHCGVMNTTFDIKECLNPHIFTYGQLPLYLSYFGINAYHTVFNIKNIQITLIEATFALRLISFTASIITVVASIEIFKIVSNLINKKIKDYFLFIFFLIIVFSPGLIQISHFGTTESLLTMFYLLLTWVSLLFLKKKIDDIIFLILSGVITGFAIATKISALLFAGVPLILFAVTNRKSIKKIVSYCIIFTVFMTICLFIGSPQSFLSFGEFIRSVSYESGIASGSIPVFYTTQFVATIPVLFQMTKVFGYASGLPVLIFLVIGFFSPKFKQREMMFLRFAFLFYLIPTSFLFVKWSRYMAPVYPIILIFAILGVIQVYFWIKSKMLALAIVIWMIIPGFAYLSVYRNTDVRYKASDWIVNHVPNGSTILTESANLIDLPLQSELNGYRSYQVMSLFMYDVDRDNTVKDMFFRSLQQAKYIIIPSRRVYMNYSCEKESQISNLKSQFLNFEFQNDKKCISLKKEYPILNEYYRLLFSGGLGFKKVAEFTSYPKISIFGKTLWEFPDEEAEETWSVFDHPVIRIYERK